MAADDSSCLRVAKRILFRSRMRGEWEVLWWRVDGHGAGTPTCALTSDHLAGRLALACWDDAGDVGSRQAAADLCNLAGSKGTSDAGTLRHLMRGNRLASTILPRRLPKDTSRLATSRRHCHPTAARLHHARTQSSEVRHGTSSNRRGRPLTRELLPRLGRSVLLPRTKHTRSACIRNSRPVTFRIHGETPSILVIRELPCHCDRLAWVVAALVSINRYHGDCRGGLGPMAALYRGVVRDTARTALAGRGTMHPAWRPAALNSSRRRSLSVHCRTAV